MGWPEIVRRLFAVAEFRASFTSLARSQSRGAVDARWMAGQGRAVVQAGPGGWTFQTALVCPAKLALAGLCGFLFGNVVHFHLV